MLQNYYEIDENETINNFLKLSGEKKNFQYIVLSGNNGFVDIRTIAIRLSNINEKLKSLKKPLSKSNTENKDENLKHIIDTGDRVIATKEGYFDYLDALKHILNSDYDFLKQKISNVEKKEVYALSEDDKISTARNLFLKQRVNLLPVISGMEVIGEVRPLDFLSNNLYLTEKRKGSFSGSNGFGMGNQGEFYRENYKESAFNMPVSNIANNRPITIEADKSIKEAVKLMIDKKLPSIIVVLNNELYSVLSHKDLYKLVKEDHKEVAYTIEYLGSDHLYEDEFDLIQDFAEKTMDKINKFSNYNELKLTFKPLGNTEGTHQKKYDLKILLAEGNKVLHIDKEVVTGTSDEEFNDKVKGKWNIPGMVQEALNNLEKKVKEEKDKRK